MASPARMLRRGQGVLDSASGRYDSSKSMTRQKCSTYPAVVADNKGVNLQRTITNDKPSTVFRAMSSGTPDAQTVAAVRYNSWRRNIWRRIVECADVGDLHPHDLRQTCATRLFVVDRWTPGDVQTFLSHRDPRVTLKIDTRITAGDLPKPSGL